MNQFAWNLKICEKYIGDVCVKKSKENICRLKRIIEVDQLATLLVNGDLHMGFACCIVLEVIIYPVKKSNDTNYWPYFQAT